MKASILRRALWLSFLAASLVSCDMPLNLDSISLSYLSATTGSRQEDTTDVFSKENLHVYYSVIEFPESYDWKKDSLYGKVSATLRLYCDSIIVQSLECDPDCQISIYASDHIIQSGALYTIFRSSNKTTLKRNGETILTIDSDETIKGLLITDGSVWTLGQNHKGLILRQNGAVVFYREGAVAYGELGELPQYPGGALYMDRGQVCFAYSKGTVWHIVRDTEETLVSAGDMLDSIDGLRQYSGKLYMLGKSDEFRGPYLYVHEGDKYRQFYLTMDERTNLRIFPSGGTILSMESVKSVFTGLWRTELWDKSKNCLSVDGEQCCVYHYDDSKTFCYVAPDSEGSMLICTPSNGKIKFEGDYYWPGSRGAAWGWGTTAVAINGPHPVLWVDGESRDLDVNGYISAVEIVRK